MSVKVPLLPFLRRRLRRTSPATPPAALAVVSIASVTPGVDELTGRVAFNTTAGAPLGDVGAADATKWTARYGDNLYDGAALTLVAYDRIDVQFVLANFEPGAEVLN